MNKKTIIAVGAHPDDIEFGCPVTVREYIAKGYDAYYIIATNGENGFKIKSMRSKDRIEERKKEALKAAALVGVKKIYFLDYKDGFLEYSESLRKKLTLIIKDIRPEVIFSFDPANLEFDNINLNHRDHRIIGTAVFDAIFAAKNDFIYPDKKGKHMVSTILFYGTHKPDYFVDISDSINFKLDVMRNFKSQFPNFENFSKFLLENIIPKDNKGRYQEAFRKIEIVQISY
ncbi:MAG: PIG-L family deacetylase [Ignavibacteria bacterium]|nr:PIG-L family deacetylase [Ignavibacteria bacterium]